MFLIRSSIWLQRSALALALALGGCMQPMLAEAPFCVTMPEPQNRLEQEFTLALAKRIRSQGGPCMQLQYNLTQQREPIIIDRDGEIARYNLVQSMNYTVLDASGAKLYSDKISAVAGVNQVEADYATYTALDGNRELLAGDMADRVYARLASLAAKSR